MEMKRHNLRTTQRRTQTLVTYYYYIRLDKKNRHVGMWVEFFFCLVFNFCVRVNCVGCARAQWKESGFEGWSREISIVWQGVMLNSDCIFEKFRFPEQALGSKMLTSFARKTGEEM